MLNYLLMHLLLIILDNYELMNKINNYSKILLSIDEMSIITNRASTNGWSLKTKLVMFIFHF
jgi:hypothetical protein